MSFHGGDLGIVMRNFIVDDAICYNVSAVLSSARGWDKMKTRDPIDIS